MLIISSKHCKSWRNWRKNGNIYDMLLYPSSITRLAPHYPFWKLEWSQKKEAKNNSFQRKKLCVTHKIVLSIHIFKITCTVPLAALWISLCNCRPSISLCLSVGPTTDHSFDQSDFLMWHIYWHIYPIDGNVAYMWHLRGIFVHDKYFVVVRLVYVAAYWFLMNVCRNLSSICRLH